MLRGMSIFMYNNIEKNDNIKQEKDVKQESERNTMAKYEFEYENRKYVLDSVKCSYFLNFEEAPVEGIDVAKILEILKEKESIAFNVEYYDQPCEHCKAGVTEKEKFFKFFECHFFLLTKNGKYVMSNISKEYENITFTKLLKKNQVDDSYLASVTVCPSCGDYSIEIEQCEI